MRRRIPYVVVGGMKFYERAEVKDVLAYLRLAARPEDDLAFRRVVNVPGARDRRGHARPARGRGARDRALVVGGLGESRPGLTERARTALARFREIVEELAREGGDVDALGPARAPPVGRRATRALYEGSEDREDVARRENIEELLSSAREFERRNAEGATDRRVPRHRRARDRRRRAPVRAAP